MSWYGKIADYTPGVSNVKGLIQGDTSQALFGAADALTGGDYLGPTLLGEKTDAEKQLGDDISGTRDMRAQFQREYDAANAAGPRGYQNVVAPSIGDAERVQFQNLGSAALQTREQLAPAERATASTVADPNAVYGARVDPIERAQAAQTSATPLAEAARLGPAAQVQAPVGLQASTAADSGFTGIQNQLSGDLLAASRGEGPSVAVAQQQQALDRNVANQYALAASQRGRDPSMAFRTAMINAANMQQATAADAATLRAQEVASARGLLGSVAGTARGQDIQRGLGNAQMQNTVGLANNENAMRTGLANQDASNQFALQQGQFQQAVGMQNSDQLNRNMNMNADRSQSAGLANAQMQNAAGLQNAEFDQAAQQANAQRLLQNSQFNAAQQQEIARANQAAGNQFALQQGTMNQSTQTANQNAVNDRGLAQGQLNQQATLANQNASNSRTEFTATQQQEAARANQQTQLTSREMDDAERERRRAAFMDANAQILSGQGAAVNARAAARDGNLKVLGAVANAGGAGGASAATK